MDPSDTNIERLDALKELGVSVVLDDFGTGYSSLAYVKRFPIDILKIDQAFVRDLTGPSAEASIVEAIIAMARGLRVGVIAEGVEELAQATMLRGLGCTRAQGYLFASALWPEAIEQLLESGSALGGFDSPAAIAG
jgi:EAL domain-containing protein (putative c-di-GMP-specific phosphodiesterase class I)